MHFKKNEKQKEKQKKPRVSTELTSSWEWRLGYVYTRLARYELRHRGYIKWCINIYLTWGSIA